MPQRCFRVLRSSADLPSTMMAPFNLMTSRTPCQERGTKKPAAQCGHPENYLDDATLPVFCPTCQTIDLAEFKGEHGRESFVEISVRTHQHSKTPGVRQTRQSSCGALEFARLRLPRSCRRPSQRYRARSDRRKVPPPCRTTLTASACRSRVSISRPTKAVSPIVIAPIFAPDRNGRMSIHSLKG